MNLQSFAKPSELAAFSADYGIARDRFRTAALANHCTLESLKIDHCGPDGQDLTMDIARWGAAQPKSIVIVSSGLHGVEGFFGSAVQLALLQGQLSALHLAEDQELILIHALNPYGFAHVRRWNEENVDLNRNFLLPEERYQGSPDGYAEINSLVNPSVPPARLDLFYPRAIAAILKIGFSRLKTLLATGQYDFPKGLFFGGQGPTKTYQLLAANLPRWVGDATRVLHIDLHTGLGAWGTYKLLTGDSPTSERLPRMDRWFGSAIIEPLHPSGTGYPIRGGLQNFCQHQFPACQYDLLTAEFGTYPGLQVVAALRAENQAHWWGNSSPHYAWTKRQLKEVFVPESPQWRSRVLAQAIGLIHQACHPS